MQFAAINGPISFTGTRFEENMISKDSTQTKVVVVYPLRFVPTYEGMTFETVAKDEARTWFSVNPVHCLRSQYIHSHKPHCHLACWGKEHLLEVPNFTSSMFKIVVFIFRGFVLFEIQE